MVNRGRSRPLTLLLPLLKLHLTQRIDQYLSWSKKEGLSEEFCFHYHLQRENIQVTKVCSLLEWSFVISTDTSWDWFQRTYVLITARKNL